MRASAALETPGTALMQITLRGTLEEFESIASQIREADIPYYTVQALLTAISDASFKLKACVYTDVETSS